MVTVSHASQHANANDAIEAIQAELGTDPAGSESTVAARIAAIEDTKYAFESSNSAGLSVTNATWTTVSDLSTTTDPWSMEAAGVATVPKAGLWLFNANTVWDTNTVNNRYIRFWKNAATAMVETNIGAATANVHLGCTWMGFLSLSDTVAFQVYQSSGTTRTLITGAQYVHWSGVYLNDGTV